MALISPQGKFKNKSTEGPCCLLLLRSQLALPNMVVYGAQEGRVAQKYSPFLLRLPASLPRPPLPSPASSSISSNSSMSNPSWGERRTIWDTDTHAGHSRDNNHFQKHWMSASGWSVCFLWLRFVWGMFWYCMLTDKVGNCWCQKFKMD